jgi:hypothetical protein
MLSQDYSVHATKFVILVFEKINKTLKFSKYYCRDRNHNNLKIYNYIYGHISRILSLLLATYHFFSFGNCATSRFLMALQLYLRSYQSY